jgi:cation transport ATPase
VSELSDQNNASADQEVKKSVKKRVKVRVRQRVRESSGDPEIRRSRKRRERWTHRRQAIQLRVLVVAAVVFFIMFLVAVVEIVTDGFPYPYIYEVLIGLATIALMVWGVFRAIEWFVFFQHKRLAQRKKRLEA